MPDSRWLRKPYSGSAGLGISLLRSHTPPREQRGGLASLKRYYYQQLLPGLPASAVFVAAGGRSVLLGATRQLIGLPWTNAGPFVYAGSIGPLWLSDSAAVKLRALGDLLAARAGLVGLFGVDFLLHGEQIAVLEVNPRYPASLEVLERSLGQPLLAWHFAACREGVLHPPPTWPAVVRCYGKAILYARERTVVSPSVAVRLLRASATPFPSLADLPSAGAAIEPTQPILTVFAGGQDMDEAEYRLKDALSDALSLLG